MASAAMPSSYPRAHARSPEAHLKLRKLKRSAKIRQRQRHSRRSPGDPRCDSIKKDPSQKIELDARWRMRSMLYYVA